MDLNKAGRLASIGTFVLMLLIAVVAIWRWISAGSVQPATLALWIPLFCALLTGLFSVVAAFITRSQKENSKRQSLKPAELNPLPVGEPAFEAIIEMTRTVMPILVSKSLDPDESKLAIEAYQKLYNVVLTATARQTSVKPGERPPG